MAAAFAAAPVLTGVLVASTAVAASAGIYAAYRQSQAAKAQAQQEEAQQRAETLAGVQRQNQILEEEQDLIAAVNIGAAASGVDPFSGSAASTKDRIRRKANRQLSISRIESETALSTSRSRQRQLRKQADASLISGFGQAAGSVSSTQNQLAQIG